MNQEKDYCIDCIESWECANWPPEDSACERVDLEDIFSISASRYEPIEELIIENPFPND